MVRLHIPVDLFDLVSRFSGQNPRFIFCFLKLLAIPILPEFDWEMAIHELFRPDDPIDQFEIAR